MINKCKSRIKASKGIIKSIEDKQQILLKSIKGIDRIIKKHIIKRDKIENENNELDYLINKEKKKLSITIYCLECEEIRAENINKIKKYKYDANNNKRKSNKIQLP
tara:strand:+ start:110 stop:427 length:318 start_codon:yes stop_codon:yes gene_type:complete